MPARPRLAAGPSTISARSLSLHSTQDVVNQGAVAVLRALDRGAWIPTGRAGLIAAVVILAGIALLALLVAAAANAKEPKRRPRGRADDPELFTSTPLPLPKEEMERMAREPLPHLAFRPARLPRWVQIGSVLGALAFTLVVAERLRERDEGSRGTADAPGEDAAAALAAAQSPSATGAVTPRDDTTGAGARPFALRAREWQQLRAGRGCVGRLEVTKGAAGVWALTLHVDDGRGTPIDSSVARVRSMIEGTVVDFSLPRTPCSRIAAWRLAGESVSR